MSEEKNINNEESINEVEETMEAVDLIGEGAEKVAGGMYQGYDGSEKDIYLTGQIPRGPGMVNPSYYKNHQYVPNPPQSGSRFGKIPPHGGMGTGMMGPGKNEYQY